MYTVLEQEAKAAEHKGDCTLEYWLSSEEPGLVAYSCASSKHLVAMLSSSS